ncbi:MAG: hypothetical protein QM487_09390 [Candidatus Marithrix sp.]
MSDKYRTKSIRLQNWDYSWNAPYFITICTKNKEYYFGNIVNNDMKLSSIGILADVFLYEIKNHAKNVELGSFIVMPNHIHMILVLNDNVNNVNNVETRHALSIFHQQTIGQQRFQNQGKNTISSIIGSYKSAVTKHAHRLGFNFAWQSRFHEHIIRNEESYNIIENYIRENPIKWNDDRFYVKTNVKTRQCR